LWSAPGETHRMCLFSWGAARRQSKRCYTTCAISVSANLSATTQWYARLCGHERRTTRASFAQVRLQASRIALSAPSALSALRMPILACAELVASVLKVGGLLDVNCNPGSATPEMLHRIYAPRAAVSANPCLLREINNSSNTCIGNLSLAERLAEREELIPPYMRSGPQTIPLSASLPAAPQQALFQPARRRAGSPPRGHFQSVTKEYAPFGTSRSGACSSRCVTTGGIQLTMDSLNFGTTTKHRPR